MRYDYATYKTQSKAYNAMESMFAEAEISEGEFPKVEPRKDHHGRVKYYAISLEDGMQ